LGFHRLRIHALTAGVIQPAHRKISEASMPAFARPILTACLALILLAPTAAAQRSAAVREFSTAERHDDHPAPQVFRARPVDARLATVRRLGATRVMSGNLGQSFSLTPRDAYVAGRGFLQTLDTSVDATVAPTGAIYAFNSSRVFIQLEGLNHARVLIDCAVSVVGDSTYMDFFVGVSNTPAAHVDPYQGVVSFLTPPIDGGALITLKSSVPSSGLVYWTVTGCEMTPMPG
jgi:hypothetical protein